MKQQASLREVNQHLARYIAIVEKGDEVIITRRGKPIAKLLAVLAKNQLTSEQKAAWTRTQQRMRKGWKLGGEKFDRDSLYDKW